MNKHKGFTLVEVLITIAVISILATISVVSYSSIQGRAMDGKIRSTVKTAGDALQVYESQNNGKLLAGQGYFNISNSIDSLAPKYLQHGYRDGLKSKNATNSNTIFRWYPCGDGSGGFVIYASLNSPSAEDENKFASIKSRCHNNDTQAPAGAGDNPRYNYAQVF